MRVVNKPFNIFDIPYMCFVTFVIHLNRKIENIEILNFDSYADIHWAYVRTYVHTIHTYIPTYIYTYIHTIQVLPAGLFGNLYTSNAWFRS